MQGMPVTLYSVVNGRLALVRQVARGMFSIFDDLHGHLYVLTLRQQSMRIVHEDAPRVTDVVRSPPPGPNSKIPPFSVGYWGAWGAIAGAGVPPGVIYATWNGPALGWTVTRIYADAVAGRPRVVAGSWKLYRHLQYGGESDEVHVKTSPGGGIVDHRVFIGYTLGRPSPGEVGPVPPRLPRDAGDVLGYESRPRGADILADTDRYFILRAETLAQLRARRAADFYVLQRRTGRWEALKLPNEWWPPRIFGAWMTATVLTPSRRQETAEEANRPWPTTQEPRDGYMTGWLLLRNLADGRAFTIRTNQLNSEVLGVSGEVVLYREGDAIYQARIGKSRVGPAKLVVKGAAVGRVHWAFWSAAAPPAG
jgi:hypothetical protein